MPWLERLHGELEIPILYVSHAADELARIADRVVLMEAGGVRAVQPVADALVDLALPFATSEDAEAFVPGIVDLHDDADALTRVAFAGGALWIPRLPHATGRRVRVRIAARDVGIALQPPGPTSLLNIVEVVIVSRVDDDRGRTLLRLDADGTALLARITRRSAQALGLHPGLRAYALIKAVAVYG